MAFFCVLVLVSAFFPFYLCPRWSYILTCFLTFTKYLNVGDFTLKSQAHRESHILCFRHIYLSIICLSIYSSFCVCMSHWWLYINIPEVEVFLSHFSLNLFFLLSFLPWWIAPQIHFTTQASLKKWEPLFLTLLQCYVKLIKFCQFYIFNVPYNTLPSVSLPCPARHRSRILPSLVWTPAVAFWMVS